MKTTLITGASSGIGEAFARRLAAERHDLLLVARSGDKLRQICDELSSSNSISAQFISADLSQRDERERLFAETREKNLEIDFLINNAGVGSMGDFAALDREKELALIELNVAALVDLTHRFLPAMRAARRGTIINVSSAAGFQPLPFMATYAATKSFVTAFSQAIAEENRPFGIQVLALCPGSTKTNFFDAAGIDRAMQVKGQQTAEQVVETAMNALDGRTSKVVSGWLNYLASASTNFVPDSLITRLVGRALRAKYQPR